MLLHMQVPSSDVERYTFAFVMIILALPSIRIRPSRFADEAGKSSWTGQQCIIAWHRCASKKDS